MFRWISIVGLICFGTIVLQAAEPAPDFLTLSGQNRSELDTAIADHTHGTTALWMLERALPFDLVNATAKDLLPHISTTQETRDRIPWKMKVSEELWREFVLPWRVADEDLEWNRPVLAERVRPVVADARETGEAVAKLHTWYYKGNEGAAWTKFRPSESRDQTPLQLLELTGNGRCFEINLAFVSLLRAAGVPARITGVSWWWTHVSYHYWVEYWDSAKQDWSYLEAANVNTGRFMARNSKLPMSTVYALPGYAKSPDPIGREAWEELIDVTPRYVPTGELVLQGGRAAAGSRVAAYTWNSSSWRSVANAVLDPDGNANLVLGCSERHYPYLITVSAPDGKRWIGTARPVVGESEILRVNPVDQRPVLTFDFGEETAK